MTETRWANRITRYGEAAPAELRRNPKNWRTHPRAQQDALAGVLSEVGWAQGVVVNERTGHLVDGHARVDLAVARKEPAVPVVYVDLSAEEEAKVLATLDPLGAMAGADPERLAALVRDVTTDDAALRSVVRDLAEANGIALEDDPPPDAPEAEIDRAEELRAKWGTASGQLWELGRHRLLCGDALEEAHIDRLLAGTTPDMVWSDPPYGISIVRAYGAAGRPKGLGTAHGAKPFGSIGRAKIVPVGVYAPVRGDESSATAMAAFRVLSGRFPRAVHVWWGAHHYADVLPPSPCWLVWDKEMEANFADCELAWTNQPTAVRSFRHRWNGMIRESERGPRLHPTQKPVALALWAFGEYGHDGDAVLDPFVGAGMSLVAAEQTARRAFGLESEPPYVAVTLERLSQLGLEPRLADA